MRHASAQDYTSCKKRIRNFTTHLTLGYYAKSTEIRWNMIKSYAFLVLIIIVMPTFGFTYLTQVFKNLFKDDTSDANRMWQCFFLADSGNRPFFNYVKFIYVFQREYRGVFWNDMSLRCYPETLNSPCKV